MRVAVDRDGQLDIYLGSDNLTRSHRVLAPARAFPPPVGEGLTVVVLNLDHPELILPLMQALAGVQESFLARGLGCNLVIGDTGSTDGQVLAAYDSAPDWVTVVRDLTYQFSRSNNDCLAAQPPHHRVLLLNNDVIFTGPGPIVAMYDAFDEHPGAGVVGLCLDYPDGTIQHWGIDLLREGPARGFPYHPGTTRQGVHRPGRTFPAIATTGACLMIGADTWRQLGGLDEQYEKECQDVDLCLAARRVGLGVLVVDAGPVQHLENATRPCGEESWPDRRLLLRRWRAYLESSFL